MRQRGTVPRNYSASYPGAGRVVCVSLGCMARGFFPQTFPTDIVCFMGEGHEWGSKVDPRTSGRWRPEDLRRIQEEAFGSLMRRPVHNAKSSPKSGLLNLSSKRHRKVYKSIIRHMYSYMKHHKEEVARNLADRGYGMTKIERCFNKISAYSSVANDITYFEECNKLFKKMVKSESTYTVVLEATLKGVLDDLHKANGEAGLEFYQGVCEDLYKRAVGLLSL